MKRLGIAVLLVALFAGAYLWFSHRERGLVVTAAAPAAPVADPKRAERAGLFGAAALKSGVEWRDSGLGYRIINEGTPPKPGIGARVKMTYVGRLVDGTVFNRSDTPSEFLIGATIPGLSVGLQMLGQGGKAIFFIPPSLGYGHRRVLGIPADSGLIFEVQIVDVQP